MFTRRKRTVFIVYTEEERAVYCMLEEPQP